MFKQNKNKNSNFKENSEDKNIIWEKVRRKFFGNPLQDFDTSDADLSMNNGIIQLPKAKDMLQAIKNDLFWLTVTISAESLQDYDKKFIYKQEQATEAASNQKWEFLKLYVRELPESALFGTWVSYQIPVGENNLTILNEAYIATRIIWIIAPVSKSWNEEKGSVRGYYADNREFEGTVDLSHKENQLYVEVSDKTSGRWSFLLSQKTEQEPECWEGFQLLLSQKEEHCKVPAVRRTIWERIHPNDFVNLSGNIKVNGYRFKTITDLPTQIQQQFNLLNKNEALLFKQQEVDNLKNQLITIQTELNSSNDEKGNLKTDLKEKTEKLAQLEGENKELNNTNTNLINDLKDKKDELSQLNKNLKEVQAESDSLKPKLEQKKKDNKELNESLKKVQAKNDKFKRLNTYKYVAIGVSVLLAIVLRYKWTEFDTIKKDLFLLPYKPTKEEIAKIEGIWECQIGSTLARIDTVADFKDKVAINFVDFKYQAGGYFTLVRYSQRFLFKGYAQFESSNLLSIHYDQFNIEGHDRSNKMRHSLMRLDVEPSDSLKKVISVSWEYSRPSEIDDIIGIREIYIKRCNEHFAGSPVNRGLGHEKIPNFCKGKDSIIVAIDKHLKLLQDSLLVGYKSFIYRNPKITPQKRYEEYEKNKLKNK